MAPDHLLVSYLESKGLRRGLEQQSRLIRGLVTQLQVPAEQKGFEMSGFPRCSEE